ncbi:MAG TPA: hypothetical protein ENK64_02565, partial [Flavobacteriales bacterium]|nr:hypothetical protein [Flavobacteriales bacterium]
MLRPIKHIIWLCIVGFSIWKVSAQNEVYQQNIHLAYKPLQKGIFVKQSILIDRQALLQRDSLVFLNWANAYKNKHTDLAKSFIENYDLNFHFANEKYRGKVTIKNVWVNQNKAVIKALQPDVYSLKLPVSDLQSDTLQISFDYLIKLPHAKFTGYGIDESGNILLKNFFFQPVFSTHQIYTDKNIDDYPSKPVKYHFSVSNFPQNKYFLSNLRTYGSLVAGIVKTPLLLWTDKPYEQLQLNGQTIFWPLNTNISATDKTRILSQIEQLWLKSFGSLPSEKIVITTADFKHHKVYGLDLLPKLLRP